MLPDESMTNAMSSRQSEWHDAKQQYTLVCVTIVGKWLFSYET